VKNEGDAAKLWGTTLHKWGGSESVGSSDVHREERLRSVRAPRRNSEALSRKTKADGHDDWGVRAVQSR
jgi:hypothetical protein